MASAHIKFAMYVQDIPPDLDQLLRYVASELEKEELESVVKSIKNTFKGKFEEQQDEDLYSCLLLFASQGLLSGKNLTLLEGFVASKASKRKEIKQRIEHFKVNRQQVSLKYAENTMIIAKAGSSVHCKNFPIKSGQQLECSPYRNGQAL